MLVEAKRHYEKSLEETVRARTDELRVLNESLNNTLEELYNNYRATLRALADTLEARDVESRGHSDRVVAYCLRLGKELNLSNNDLIALEQGALLHDIGKMGLPDYLLMKTGVFSNEERRLMREHIERGLYIVDKIDFLRGARPVVGQHHEKFDGSGYPQGLRGEEIHLHARIFAVADAYDAITSDRPYRAAKPYAFARAELVANARTQFDPKVVNAFLQIPEWEWEEMRHSAGSHNYVEHFIDRRDIRSFIISLKRNSTGNTGQLNPDFLAHSGLLATMKLN
jgi:putative nucleotidyltransferase with HDIG domain